MRCGGVEENYESLGCKMSGSVNLVESAKNAFRPAKRVIFELLYVLQARRILRSREISESREMFLVFLIAYPQMWNTFKPIYDEAAERGVGVSVVALPRFRGGRFDVKKNEMLEYCMEVGIEAIPAFDCSTGDWLDIESIAPSHVFYARPYLQEYPDAYAPRKVSMYAYTCFIPYGDVETVPSPHYDIIYNREFLSKMNYIFPCSEPVREAVERDSLLLIKEGMTVVVKSPDPRLCQVAKSLNADKEDGVFTILYTPRWAVKDNPNLTSFFEYMAPLIEYVNNCVNVKLIVRPHPLAMDTFVKEGKMSWADVERLRRYMKLRPNLEFDENEDYIVSFSEADVMISDYSALVWEFFVSGKPILYTDDPFAIEGRLAGVFAAMYSIDSWEDMENALTMLRKGEDSKRDARKRELARYDLNLSCGEIILRELGIS